MRHKKIKTFFSIFIIAIVLLSSKNSFAATTAIPENLSNQAIEKILESKAGQAPTRYARPKPPSMRVNLANNAKKLAKRGWLSKLLDEVLDFLITTRIGQLVAVKGGSLTFGVAAIIVNAIGVIALTAGVPASFLLAGYGTKKQFNANETKYLLDMWYEFLAKEPFVYDEIMERIEKVKQILVRASNAKEDPNKRYFTNKRINIKMGMSHVSYHHDYTFFLPAHHFFVNDNGKTIAVEVMQLFLRLIGSENQFNEQKLRDEATSYLKTDYSDFYPSYPYRFKKFKHSDDFGIPENLPEERDDGLYYRFIVAPNAGTDHKVPCEADKRIHTLIDGIEEDATCSFIPTLHIFDQSQFEYLDKVKSFFQESRELVQFWTNDLDPEDHGFGRGLTDELVDITFVSAIFIAVKNIILNRIPYKWIRRILKVYLFLKCFIWDPLGGEILYLDVDERTDDIYKTEITDQETGDKRKIGVFTQNQDNEIFMIERFEQEVLEEYYWPYIHYFVDEKSRYFQTFNPKAFKYDFLRYRGFEFIYIESM